MHRTPSPHTHHYCTTFESAVLHGQAVFRVLSQLARAGYRPDVVLAHPGWGETLYLKQAFPNARLLHLCEWYYGHNAPDIGFDPEFPVSLDDRLRSTSRQAHHLMALDMCDVTVAPTEWQKSQFPAAYQSKIQVLHEGVPTRELGPDPNASFTLPNGRTLRAGQAIVTYVARNLEPYRGFHVFMRSLPAILAAHPQCQVLVVGGDDVSYGRPPTPAGNWRDALLAEVPIDPERVHFLGKLPYGQYRRLLQVSAAHVYLTYPFVLSWSLLEALASGCAVVASDTAPVREVIRHGHNGLLVDFFSPSHISQTVLQVLAATDQMRPMRQAAMVSVRDTYEQTAATQRYLAWMGIGDQAAATATLVE